MAGSFESFIGINRSEAANRKEGWILGVQVPG